MQLQVCLWPNLNPNTVQMNQNLNLQCWVHFPPLIGGQIMAYKRNHILAVFLYRYDIPSIIDE